MNASFNASFYASFHAFIIVFAATINFKFDYVSLTVELTIVM